jgi:hypothetical protein
MSCITKIPPWFAFILSATVSITILGCRDKTKSPSPRQESLDALRGTLRERLTVLDKDAAKTTNSAILQADINAVNKIINSTIFSTNTPLKVHGGSVTVIPPLTQKVDCNTSKPSCVVHVDPDAESAIQFDGIALGDGSVTSTQLTPKQGWKITLTFQDSLGKKDPKQTLTICTDEDCSATGPFTGQLYLRGNPDPYGDNWVSLQGSSNYSYTVGQCHGPTGGAESTCNHIFDIRFQTPGNNPPFYQCMNGKCDITIGPPPSQN